MEANNRSTGMGRWVARDRRSAFDLPTIISSCDFQRRKWSESHLPRECRSAYCFEQPRVMREIVVHGFEVESHYGCNLPTLGMFCRRQSAEAFSWALQPGRLLSTDPYELLLIVRLARSLSHSLRYMLMPLLSPH